jgi:hypothetical protein
MGVCDTRLSVFTAYFLLAGTAVHGYTSSPSTAVPLPSAFVRNRGQAPEQVLFTASTGNMRAVFERSRVWLGTQEGWISRELVGAAPKSRIVPLAVLPGRITYLHASRSATSELYSGIEYRAVYPGIHTRYKTSGHRIKSEFIVGPQADPAAIQVRYPGCELSIAADGALVVARERVSLREEAPEAYQDGMRIPARYRLVARDKVAFDLGRYNPDRELIIDPVLSFSTYAGGSRLDEATAIATDSHGNIYVAGWTDSTDFPSTGPAGLRGVGADAFVAKLNAAGALVFAAVFGGSAQEKALGISVDSAGRVYVAGSTASADFPLTIPGRLRGSTDAFLVRLAASGQQFDWSLLAGGDGSETAYGITVDAAANAYIAGETSSANFPVYPTGNGVFAGQIDAFVTAVNTSGTVLYSRLLGGSQVDRAKAIAVDSAGRTYITGRTDSLNFPVAAAFQPALSGGMDAFVTRLDATGTVLLYSTFLGGRAGSELFPEEGASIAVDSSGRAFICGTTPSADFPVANAVQSNYGGGSTDAFVAALAPYGQALVFSTFVGGSALDYGTGVSLDATANVWFAGYTASRNFPSAASSFGAGGLFDAFIGSMTTAGVRAFTMRVGGTGDDTAASIAAGWGDSALIAGATSSADLPLKDAFQTQNTGSSAFIARIATPRAPQIGSLAPSSATGLTQVLTTQVADPNGAQDIVTVRWQIGNACEIRYLRTSGTFQLLNDAGTAYTGSLTPGSGATIANSQCELQGSGTAVTSSDYTLLITMRVNLLPAYSGTRTISVESSDGVSSSGLQLMGTWVAGRSTPGLGFMTVPPCRVVDTRSGQGRTGAFGPPSLASSAERSFPIVSSPNCAVLSSAQAFSLNTTVSPKGQLDYLALWPAGQTFPGVSTLNSPNGAIIANAAIVPAGTGGAITAVVAGSSSDLISDINGYFAPPSDGELLFYAIPPCRVADTRSGQAQTGAFGPPALAAYAERDFPVRGTCGLPASAQAYALNVTAVPAGSVGFLSIWPTGQLWPGVSTLNSPNGTTIANAAIVPAGTNGSIRVLASDATNLILDINGYFAPAGAAGLRLYPLKPCRAADTRAGQGTTGAFGPPALTAYSARTFPLRSSACGVPADAQAYSLNITVVPGGQLDFLSIWPTGQAWPGVSTLNSQSGRNIANAAMVPAGINGSVDVLASNATHVIIDINGYFAP